MDLFAPGLFQDQVALVTGGGTGIGRATALMFAALGGRVAIASRSREHLDPTLADLEREHPGRALAETCDIREPEQIARLVDGVLARFGSIDVLVNNAGGQFPSQAETLSAKGFDAVVRNNLSGTFYVTQAVATRAMIPSRRGGRIVNVIANIARGFPGMVHTGAARAGVENMTRTLAVEWARHRILVNSVAPGVIRSSGTERYPAELVELARRRTPLKRTGTVDEVAAAILYLASPAGAFITGTTLQIDGGAALWGDTWEIPDPE